MRRFTSAFSSAFASSSRPVIALAIAVTLASLQPLVLAASPAKPKAPVAAPALNVTTLAVISLADDPRYETRLVEKAYVGHTAGRAFEAAQLGAEDSAFELDVEGKALKVTDVVLQSASDLGKALEGLKREGVHHVIADLPTAAMLDLVAKAPKALDGAIVFNASLPDDDLRGTRCAANLLHTFPSNAMLADALTQYLASKSWRKALLLKGSGPDDEALTTSFKRAGKRYGVQVVEEKPFKLSGDPRERDLANVRLLTGERSHDVVAVMDGIGEFARTVPYATQWPRPVVGSNGLVALAWHPQWDRYGGPQLTRRFVKAAGRPMQGQDWAAWMAARAVATVMVDQPKANVNQQLAALRSGQVQLDGFKGKTLSFRSWSGQLRQPIFLSHVDGVVAMAPVDGVLHPKEVMDTLGFDERESTCKAR